MSQEDKIISKVRKLLNTANGTAEGGEHERDTAMRMALNLLAKHNLSMSDLEESKQEDRCVDNDSTFHSAPWMRTVGYAMAELFFCAFYVTRIHGKNRLRFTFIGREGNVQTAKEMTTYLIKSVESESRKAQKQHGQTGEWAGGFRKGAGMRIWVRSKELRKQAEQESNAATTGTALVLASVYAQEKSKNEQYIQGMGVELTVRKAVTHKTNTSGYIAGDNFGKTVSLNKQVGA